MPECLTFLSKLTTKDKNKSIVDFGDYYYNKAEGLFLHTGVFPMRKFGVFLFLCFLVAFGFVCLAGDAQEVAQEMAGEVVMVLSGDTLSVKVESKATEVRLHGIACPVRGQPYADEAKSFLMRSTLGRRVTVEVVSETDSTHVAGRVFLMDGTAIGERVLSAGYGWWDKSAAPDSVEFGQLQDDAKEKGVGLWTDEDAMEPWAFQDTVDTEPPEMDTIIVYLLACLVCGLLLLVFFLFNKMRGASNHVARESSTDYKTIENCKRSIRDLLDNISGTVTGLTEDNQDYHESLKGHKASIAKQTTIKGLKQIERLLVGELDRMLAKSNDYQDRLAQANATIKEQEEAIEQIQTDANKDSLTGIANRRAFSARINEELDRAERYGSVFSLILFDIDNFKAVNDKYGHLGGDRVLEGLTGVVADCLRSSDFFARYGGEEFAIILPQIPAEGALLVAEKARKTVEATTVTSGNDRIKVTISAGVSEVRAGKDTRESLITRVDEAMYSAKQGGKNRVERPGTKN